MALKPIQHSIEGLCLGCEKLLTTGKVRDRFHDRECMREYFQSKKNGIKRDITTDSKTEKTVEEAKGTKV